jgi:hypothetical protein
MQGGEAADSAALEVEASAQTGLRCLFIDTGIVNVEALLALGPSNWLL